MRTVLACSLLLLARHASADDAVDLRFRSTGREVTIELRDSEQHACTTPCMLRVPPGEYRARVDGLDRLVIASNSEVVITPTRNSRMGLALALVTLGAVALGIASHWSSPIHDNEDRLAAVIAGGSLMGFAIPIIMSSDARVGAGPSLSRVDVFAGMHYPISDRDAMVALGVGYRPRAVGFGAQLRGRLTDSAAIYQLAIGPTLHSPRFALFRFAVAAHVGFSSQRGDETPADLPTETPAIPGEIGLHALVDGEARIEIELPSVVQPSIGVTAQTVPDRRVAQIGRAHV